MTENEMLSHSFTPVLQVSAVTVDSVLGVEQCQTAMAVTVRFDLLTPNVNYSGRTAPLTSKVAFYIFIQQI